MASKNHNKLQIYYKEERFALAYALCEKYPELKDTSEYQKMEQLYEQKFLEAQKKLLLNRVEEAKELLQPFVTISSKYATTKLILQHHKAFVEFLKAMAAKEYDKLASLVKKHPAFSTLASYISLQNELFNTLDTIHQDILHTKTKRALKELEQYRSFNCIEEEVHNLILLAQNVQMFLNNYEENDFVACYEIIDANKNIASMQLVQLLQKHWEQTVQKCRTYAAEGNIVAIKELLGELVNISTRQDTIKELFCLSFIGKIEQELLKKNYASAENFIYSYLDIFGLDSKIKKLMKSYEKRTSRKLAITAKESGGGWNLHDLY